MSLSNKSYEELEKASQDWANWHKKVIILDEGRKATYSKLFLKHKLDTKTIDVRCSNASCRANGKGRN